MYIKFHMLCMQMTSYIFILNLIQQFLIAEKCYKKNNAIA